MWCLLTSGMPCQEENNAMKCPYYRKISLQDHPYGLKGYCEGDVQGRLRVPSVYEETHLCTTSHYPACRVFQERQAHIEREQAQGDPQAGADGEHHD